MPKQANRVALTVRLDADDKAFFSEEAERCGLEPSVAARQILELYVRRMRAGGDFVDALFELKSAWQSSDRAA